MRRLFLCVVAPAVLAVSVSAPSFAAVGKRFSMQFGSTLTITGHTGAVQPSHTRATGKVVLSGRWGHGAWHVLTTALADSSGTYRFRYKPHHRGNVTLRIAPPDHKSRQYVLHVY